MITIKLNMIPPILQLTEVHISTTWEIATDETFTDIIYTHTTSLDLTRHNVPPTDITIPSNQTIFARGRATTNLRIHEFNLSTLMFITVMDDTTDGGTGGGSGDGTDFISTTGTVDATLMYLNWEVRKSDTDQLIWSGDQLEATVGNIPPGTLDPNENYKISLKKQKVFIPLVIDPPLLAVEGEPNDVVLAPTMTTSAFTVSIGTDTHISTDWVIEDTVGTVVWQSSADTVNLTTITVPANILVNGASYVFKVRYNGAVVSSGWTSETHNTPALPIINAPLLAVEGEPGDIVLEPILTTSAFNMSIGTDTHVSTDWVIEDDVGNVLWQSSADTVNLTTITVPTAILTNSTVYTFRVRHNGAVVSSGWTNESHTTITLIITAWTSVANYPIPIMSNSQSTLVDGRVLIVGGWDGVGRTDPTYIYNPVSNVWSSAANYPTVLSGHTQSTLPDGRVLVVGGLITGSATSHAYIYNPATNTWTSAANCPTVIRSHSQSTLPDGRVLVVGGWDATGRTNLAHIYNPTTNVWTSAANYPMIIESHTQSTLIDDRVLVVGGVGITTYTNRSYIYDPVTNAWSSAANYPMEVMRHSQSTLIDGRVLVVGGNGSAGNNLANIYDPVTDVWSSVANYSTTINHHSQSTLTDNRILVVGGWGTTGPTNRSTIYTP